MKPIEHTHTDIDFSVQAIVGLYTTHHTLAFYHVMYLLHPGYHLRQKIHTKVIRYN